MPDFKELAKGGWHPKGKDGKPKESWRGDNKGINQVAGWIGKGKDPSTKAHDHVSRPLSTLKDPAAFGPPPKNVNYHGGAALPNQITPDTRGLGGPLSSDEIYAKQRAEEEEAQREAEAAKPKGPSLQFRADTTGLSTANLPPPPARRGGADGRTPPLATKPKPGLPPRLPPRVNSNPTSPPSAYSSTTSEPESHKGILNQGSMNRLSAAGVSVPEFGIVGKGRQPLPPPGPASPSRTSAASSVNSAQLNELQSRFSRLSSSTAPKPESPSEGTTFAQKQAAFKTASAFRDDPSSVSLSDAKAAASTANNFRERHGEQVKSGFQTANKLNSRYGTADKVGAFGGIANTQRPEPANPQIEMRDNTTHGNANGGPELGVLGKKKPPPPPMKKAALAGATASPEPVPPPIPLSSKPKPPINMFKHLEAIWAEFAREFIAGTAPPQRRRSTNHNHESSYRQSHSHPQRPRSRTYGRSQGHRYQGRPLTSQPASSHNAKDYDLDLKSLWFAKSPVSFPPPSMNRDGKLIVAYSQGWSSSGVRRTHTFTAHVRSTTTLAGTKIHLTWDASNPGLTVKADQRHDPPPRHLNQGELESCRERYSGAVADWSESQMGSQVGDGECWTLANNALKAVAAKCSSRGQEPCMASQSYIHGFLMYSFVPSASRPEPQGKVKNAGVARGDVIQLYKAHFKYPGGEAWAGAPHHTAVITGVDSDGVLRVVEQNVGGKKRVQPGKYNLAQMVSGEVRIYRAVGESWIGKLDPKW